MSEKNSKFHNYFIIGGICLGSLVFILFSAMATLYYPGTKMIYIIFSFISFFMIGMIWVGHFSYFYFFLACFWLLGFWSKATMLFAFKYPLIEPIGIFLPNTYSWDKVFIIASTGLLAFIFAKLVIGIIDCLFKVSSKENGEVTSPVWYKQHSALIWYITLFFAVITALINYYYKLYQVGVIPTHHFPYKLGAFVPCIINMGFSFWFATLLWWDVINKKKNLLYRLTLIILASCLLSSSILSRGLYLYQTANYSVSLFLNRAKTHLTPITLIFYVILFIIGFSINLKLTTYMRDSLYPTIGTKITSAQPLPIKETKLKIANNNPEISSIQLMAGKIDNNSRIDTPQPSKREFSSSGKGNLFVKLATGRWVGLEGLMAVSSWNQLGTTTLINGWTQRMARGSLNPYPEISKAEYFKPEYPEKDKFFFSPLPGLTAMLFYSNSLCIVFFGTFLISLFYIYMERAIYFLLKNPFAVSFYGLYTAALISMISDAPAIFAQTIEMMMITILLWLLQKYSSLWV